MVSILLPSRNERYLQKTITDLLAKARGEIEILAVLDGAWPDPALMDDPRVHVIHHGAPKGMRPAINGATRIAKGAYFMKLDAHCMVEEGFDVTLAADCEPDWMVVPRRCSLEPESWTFKQNGKAPVDAHFLSYPYEYDRPGVGLHGTVWTERAKARADVVVDDEMSSQGSCWFMSRAHWDRLGEMQSEHYGNFVQEFQELGNKTWLGGGRVVVNKCTWYAHWHKGKDGRGYFISKHEMSDGAKFCVDWWMNNRWVQRAHDMRWLIQKFWPVPGWPTSSTGALDWDVVERATALFTQRYQAGLPVGF